MLGFEFTQEQARYVERLAMRYVKYRKSASIDTQDLTAAAQIRWWQFTTRNPDLMDERVIQICFYQQVKGAMRDVVRDSAPLKVTRTMQAHQAYQAPRMVEFDHVLDLRAGDSLPVDREMWMDVVTSLKKLPEREQLILSLYFEQGLSYTEIAEVFEVSVSTITRAYRKALDTVQSDLTRANNNAKKRTI